MEGTMFQSPWQHLVVDDLYDITGVVEEVKTYIRKNANVLVEGSKTITFENFDELPITKSQLDKVDLLQYLEHFDHRPVKNPVVENHINVNLPNHEYRIHDELPRKILSVVTYLSPNVSYGTLLYDENKNFSHEVEWQLGRTMIFAGDTGRTWHNFKSGDKIRITLNSFIVDK